MILRRKIIHVWRRRAPYKILIRSMKRKLMEQQCAEYEAKLRYSAVLGKLTDVSAELEEELIQLGASLAAERSGSGEENPAKSFDISAIAKSHNVCRSDVGYLMRHGACTYYYGKAAKGGGEEPPAAAAAAAEIPDSPDLKSLRSLIPARPAHCFSYLTMYRCHASDGIPNISDEQLKAIPRFPKSQLGMVKPWKHSESIQCIPESSQKPVAVSPDNLTKNHLQQQHSSQKSEGSTLHYKSMEEEWPTRTQTPRDTSVIQFGTVQWHPKSLFN